MKIVHLELPRIFTLSVREYMTEVAAELERQGHTFEQYDINPNFWKWLLGLSTPHSPRDLFEPVINAGESTNLFALLAEVRAHLNDVSRLYGMPLGLEGIDLPREVANSSYAMCSLVADNFGCGLFSNFFQHLDERLRFRDASLISLGLESPEGVFWALQLAAWLRAAGSTAHLCIARHAWENFTLLHHIDDLAKNPWFFGVIESVILYQEELPETLGLLVEVLEGAPRDALHNIAIKAGDAVNVIPPRAETRTALRVSKTGYRIPDRYFQAMEAPPDHLVYSMAMVRNKCFYKKCTFCVQIAKHISDHAYSEAAEIARALDACAELERHGIAMVNFMDEAMRPVDIRDFCAGRQSRQLGIRWVGRMIAAAHPDRELLAMMKQSGCTEILFGLETFDPALSADMGKISRLHETALDTAAMIESFLEAGLFLILSMIYEFPTETPDARRRTLENLARLQRGSNRFAIIFNRFHLLHASKMYQNPAVFNIQHIEARLPENDLQYHFGYECQKPLPSATPDELAAMHRMSLRLPEELYGALLRRYGREVLDLGYFLDYVSIGFRHRTLKDATLFAQMYSCAHSEDAFDLPTSAIPLSPPAAAPSQSLPQSAPHPAGRKNPDPPPAPPPAHSSPPTPAAVPPAAAAAPH